MTKNLKNLAGYTITALILGAAFLLAASAGQARTAQAAALAPVTAPVTAVNWHERTCQAATAYQAHPSAASLATLVTDSTHLGRSYLKADVGQLYADASSPSSKAGKYAAKDEQYIAEDCAS